MRKKIDVGRPVGGERLLTIIELAQFLGVPAATLYQWRHKGEGPPGMKVGRHIRYRPEAVREWLADLETTVKRP